jgi:quercetin 2,3-dioxygenase
MPSSARLYLADQRGLLTTAQRQCLSTLNFGAYMAEGRAPFGRLRALNEERLAPGQAVALPVAEATLLVLLPIEGAVAYQGPAGLAGTTDVEQVQVLALPAGSTVALRNPYPDAVITFLHLWLAAEASVEANGQLFAYSFGQLENTLAELVSLGPLPFGLHLGRFQGRCEAAHLVQASGNSVFAFVLAGAFELQNCLLHAGDGLGLRDCATVELEALSNGALVLLLELR